MSYAKRKFAEVSRVVQSSKLFFYEREMRIWMSGFWGVSFRYITNYLNWFRIYYNNNKESVSYTHLIVGSSKLERIKLAVNALDLHMEVQDWYKIWQSSTGRRID